MFANDQVKRWESKVQETFAGAQKIAQERAHRVEAEARKALELLGDRAQAEMKQLLATAQEGTRERWARLGGELIKLGQRLQAMSKAPPGTPEEEAAKVAVVDAQPPPSGDVH